MPVAATNLHPRLRFPLKDAERIARAVLRREGTRVSELNVVFVNHRRMIALNARYLRHRRTTDVIAFGYETDPVEGDVFVNLDQARQQGKEYRVPFRAEVARLLIHGVLHLAGYDDTTAAKRGKMRKKEDAYLRALA